MRLTTLVLLGALLATPALAEPPFPDYEVTPLTKADVDFYLGILHAAADHNAHLNADDKAAIALSIQMQKHPPSEPKGMPTQADIDRMTRNANLMARAAELGTYDLKIAEQRGVTKRYDAMSSKIGSVVVQITGEGASCGGDCTPPGGFSAAVLARAKKEQAATDADKPLVQPHVAEIKALRKQIGGFMFGGN